MLWPLHMLPHSLVPFVYFLINAVYELSAIGIADVLKGDMWLAIWTCASLPLSVGSVVRADFQSLRRGVSGVEGP